MEYKSKDLNGSRVNNSSLLNAKVFSKASLIALFPVRVLTVAVVITLVVFTFFCFQAWNSYKNFKTTKTHYLQLQKLSGTIAQFDEVLTMSARMGAATGDLRWEKRYREFEPQLDVAIKEVVELAPDAFLSEAATNTDTANIKLVAMENRAFDLIRQGRRDAAMSQLFSNEYEEQKKIYSNGMRKITIGLQEHVDGALKAQWQKSLFAVASSVFILPVLIFSWFGVVRLIARDISKRKELEVSLKNAYQDLEKKVKERTANLNIANEHLQQEINVRTQAEKKLFEYQNRLKSLTSQMTLAEENERRRFADYLHDQIGQKLFVLKLKMEALINSTSSNNTVNALDDSFKIITQLINDTRSLTFDLSPPILYQFGLEAALEWLTEQTSKQYGIKISFEDDEQEKELSDDIKILMFQAVRELLTNVVKHARAQNAKVSIQRDNTRIRVCVEDNGVGFTPTSESFSKESNQGFGLFSIKERLDYLGGQLEIESQPDCGTQATLVAPLKGKK